MSPAASQYADARAFVVRALAGGDVVDPAEVEGWYDVDGIVNECHRITEGWDFTEVPDDRFWQIVARHDKSTL